MHSYMFHSAINVAALRMFQILAAAACRVPPANLSPRYHRQWQRETSRWPTEVAGDGWDAVAGFGTCAHRQMRCFPQR